MPLNLEEKKHHVTFHIHATILNYTDIIEENNLKDALSHISKTNDLDEVSNHPRRRLLIFNWHRNTESTQELWTREQQHPQRKPCHMRFSLRF